MPEEERQKGGFLAFWTTLPGILTGLAALITAVVGAIGLWKSQGDGSGSGSSSLPTPSIPITSTAKATPTRSKTPGTILRGRVALLRDDEADLESGQIGFSANADLQLGPETTPNLFGANSAFLAPLDGPPTKPACTMVLRSRHDSFEIIPQLAGKWICVSTTEGHVAVVQVLQEPGVGNAKLVLGYTVWT